MAKFHNKPTGNLKGGYDTVNPALDHYFL